MFSFAYISEHINGIKGNLFTRKQILALFYLTAPLSTPLGESIAKGWLWAVAGLRLCPKPAGPRWLSWHTQLCSPAGGTNAPKTRSPTPGKVPEAALCSSQHWSTSRAPWMPPADELLWSLCQFLRWQQRDRQTCKPLPKDSPHLFFQAEARSKSFKACSQT